METTLKILSESNRLRIVQVLIERPHAVGEIVDDLELSQSLVSKHLHALSKAGLVEVQAVAQRRVYKLRAKPFQEIDEWLQSFRRLWENRFDRLDEVLAEEKKKMAVRKN